MSVDSRTVLRDTTLREGVQIPGSRISLDHKREFLRLLEQAGVPEVEIGLPDGMTECRELMEFLRGSGLRIRPTALVPCYGARWRKQVDLAAELGLRRIDITAPVSDHLLRDGSHYRLSEAEIAPRLRDVLAHARRTGLELGVGLIDACRAPRERIERLVQPLGDQGVSRLVLYDSVGTMLPSAMAPLTRAVLKAGRVPILVHCHNDYGLATANTLAAIEGGATAADVAVSGLGGRAGNAPLEEVAVALANLLGRPTGIDLRRLRGLSELAERMTGLRTWPLKPVVGDFCFAHVPVMHIRCIAGGNPPAFEPFDPAQIGAERTYDFALPVDYAEALEPFIASSGCPIAAEEVPDLVEALRRAGGPSGCTWPQVIQCIQDFRRGLPT